MTRIAAIGAFLFCIAGTTIEALAQLTVYTDRAAFIAAIPPERRLFNTFDQDATFQLGNNFYSGLNFQFTFYGANVGENSISGGAFHGDVAGSLFGPRSFDFRVTPAWALFAFGADFSNANDDASGGGLKIAGIEVRDYLPSPGTGFFGVMGPLDVIPFDPYDVLAPGTGLGAEKFTMDNLVLSVVVPEPSAGTLLGVTISVAGARRRRRATPVESRWELAGHGVVRAEQD